MIFRQLLISREVNRKKLEAMISVTNVSKQYTTEAGPVAALEDVSLEVPAGHLHALMGASGSGKSTMLGLMAGLDVPDRGTVEVKGVTVSGLGEDDRARFRLSTVALIFQDDNLIAELTNGRNVELLLRAKGMGGRQAREVTAKALAEVGIADLADRAPATVSGGQRQRVGVARALAGDNRCCWPTNPPAHWTPRPLDACSASSPAWLTTTACAWSSPPTTPSSPSTATR